MQFRYYVRILSKITNFYKHVRVITIFDANFQKIYDSKRQKWIFIFFCRKLRISTNIYEYLQYSMKIYENLHQKKAEIVCL